MNDLPKFVRWLLIGFVMYVIVTEMVDRQKRNAHIAAAPSAPVATGPEVSRVDTLMGQGAPVVCGQTVAIRYQGFLPDGRPFDSNTSAEAPLTFRVGEGRVIKGWEQGVLGMKAGGKRKITVPAILGYDDEDFANPAVPKGHDVSFDIDLVSASPERPVSPMPIKVFDARPGTGQPVQCGKEASVHYALWSITGQKLVDSRDAGGPVSVRPGSGTVWYGLERTVAGMTVGAARTAIVPAPFMAPWPPAQNPTPTDFPGKALTFENGQALILDVERVK